MGGILLIGGILSIALGACVLYLAGMAASASTAERAGKWGVRFGFGGLAALASGAAILFNGLS